MTRPSRLDELRKLLPAREHPYLMAASLARESDLTASVGKRKNQGRSSSCSAHAITSGLYAAQIGAGIADPIDGSPHLVYSLSGRLERPFAALQDDGRQLVDVLAVVRTVGLAPMQAPTPDGRWSDVWTAEEGPDPNVCVPATGAEILSCVRHAYDVGNHTIDPTAPDRDDLIVATLTAPSPAPVLLATRVGARFDSLSPGQVAEPDPDGSGHALIICGHRTLASGDRQFLVDNSWGDWDENGECWVSSAWAGACWELHPLTMSPQGNLACSLVDRMRGALSLVR